MTTSPGNNNEIHSLETKLGIYKVKIEDLEKKAKVQVAQIDQTLIDELKLKQQKFEAQLDLAREKGSLALSDVKKGLEKAWHDLKTSVDSAINRF